MPNITPAEVCAVVEKALRDATGKHQLSAPVTPSSRMGSPIEWDSLAFVLVFTAVGEHFGVELEDDDAMEFTSIGGIVNFLQALED